MHLLINICLCIFYCYIEFWMNLHSAQNCPEYDFFSKTVGKRSKGSESIQPKCKNMIGSQHHLPIKQKLFLSNYDSNYWLDKNGSQSNKNYLTGNLSLSGKNNQLQNFNYFVGSKHRTEGINHARNLKISGQNLYKQEQNNPQLMSAQKVKRTDSIQKINIDNIRSSTYGSDSKPTKSRIGWFNNFLQAGNQPKERVSRASTTSYGSGSIRTNTSTKGLWNRQSNGSEVVSDK